MFSRLLPWLTRQSPSVSNGADALCHYDFSGSLCTRKDRKIREMDGCAWILQHYTPELAGISVGEVPCKPIAIHVGNRALRDAIVKSEAVHGDGF
eukprot:s1331_g17.t1